MSSFSENLKKHWEACAPSNYYGDRSSFVQMVKGVRYSESEYDARSGYMDYSIKNPVLKLGYEFGWVVAGAAVLLAAPVAAVALIIKDKDEDTAYRVGERILNIFQYGSMVPFAALVDGVRGGSAVVRAGLDTMREGPSC